MEIKSFDLTLLDSEGNVIVEAKDIQPTEIEFSNIPTPEGHTDSIQKDVIERVSIKDNKVHATKIENGMEIIVQDKCIQGKVKIGSYLYIHNYDQYFYADNSDGAIQIGVVTQQIGLRFRWQIKKNLVDFLKNIFSKFYIVKITQ